MTAPRPAPATALIGFSGSRRQVQCRAAVLFAVLVIVIAAVIVVNSRGDGRVEVRLDAPTVATGIGPGTPVQINGVKVGAVSALGPGASLGSGTARAHTITMRIDDRYRRLLTTGTQVAYAPRNLFGVAAVVLRTTSEGRGLRDGEILRPSSAPEDATLTTLLRKLTDLDDNALGAHMGPVLASVNKLTDGMLPVIGSAGMIADLISQTQNTPTATSIPQLVRFTDVLADMLDNSVTGFESVREWTGPSEPGYPADQAGTIRYFIDVLLPAIMKVETPELFQFLRYIVPPATNLTDAALASMPDAGRNGKQLRALISRLSAAMPTSNGNTSLNVDVLVPRLPGIPTTPGTHTARKGGR